MKAPGPTVLPEVVPPWARGPTTSAKYTPTVGAVL